MIRSIRLKNFRRYADETVSFEAGPNFVEGENNAGKTSILYGVEYALFGRVDGFKSMLSLLAPGARGLGVEMVFVARDGEAYRLQRVHQLPPRSRTKLAGHFTLKKLGDPETYVLSSDFSDLEDTLALKLQELTGVTRRLFQVAMHMRQGEITHILDGAPELDIVLGVTAAVMASDELRAQALELEKEAASLPVLEESARRVEDERTRIAEQLASAQSEAGRLEKRAADLAAKAERAASTEAARAALVKVFEAFQAGDDAAEQAAGRSAEHEARVAALSADGGRDQITERLGASEAREQAIAERRREREARVQELEGVLRSEERVRGDLTGRVARREALAKGGDATCEVCGAPVDAARNERDLAGWKAEIELVDARVAAATSEVESAKSSLRELEAEDRSLAIQRTTDRARLAELEELLRAGSAMRDAAQEGARARDALRVALVAAANAWVEEPPLEFDPDNARALGKVLADLAALVAERRGRLEAERDAAGEQARRWNEERDGVAERALELEREIAGLRERVASAREKASRAIVLRRLSEGFKELQTSLRERASVALAADAHALHAKLSVGESRPHEFDRIVVDAAKYSVRVVPKHLGEEVPASLYEGGGHRLLLGLAFKLAVARLSGRVPFVLLDEPTYGLDERHRGTLLDRIADIGVADQILVITHETMGRVSGRRVRVAREGNASRIVEVT